MYGVHVHENTYQILMNSYKLTSNLINKKLVELLHYMQFYSLYTGGLLTRGITHKHIYQVISHLTI